MQMIGLHCLDAGELLLQHWTSGRNRLFLPWCTSAGVVVVTSTERQIAPCLAASLRTFHLAIPHPVPVRAEVAAVAAEVRLPR